MAADPAFIVADEALAALDVSIQAQMVNLLQDLKEELGLTYLFIAHDLAMVRYLADRTAVLYLGRIAEIADSEELAQRPLHPYTLALLSAAPIPDPVAEAKREHIVLPGDVPDPAKPPSGCRFHTRCSFATTLCQEKEPELRDLGASGPHLVACHHAEKVSPARGKQVIQPLAAIKKTRRESRRVRTGSSQDRAHRNSRLSQLPVQRYPSQHRQTVRRGLRRRNRQASRPRAGAPVLPLQRFATSGARSNWCLP
ncbi:MAG: ABC transporter ATP-binding protein [Nocardioidaceae bacterium]